jgi:hypothetical protein
MVIIIAVAGFASERWSLFQRNLRYSKKLGKQH